MQLFDLAGANPALRFSPFCWRARMALAHKGLAVETLPWRFLEKDRIAHAGTTVPVLVDGTRSVADSNAIAEYLEDSHPDRPSLFGGPGGRALSRYFVSWTDGTLHPLVARCVVKDIFDCIAPSDQPYFRESREKRFGMTLEQVQANRDETVLALRQALMPLRFMLAKQPFLGGATPLYPDYIVFGAFMWARNVSAFKLLEADDPVHAWRARLLAAFDGLAATSLGYDI